MQIKLKKNLGATFFQVPSVRALLKRFQQLPYIQFQMFIVLTKNVVHKSKQQS